MHRAAVSAETGLIVLLLSHGARIDGRDDEGLSPLMRAARTCSYWNIRALRDAGADMRAATLEGRTALELATPQIDSGLDGAFARNRDNCEKTRDVLRDAR